MSHGRSYAPIRLAVAALLLAAGCTKKAPAPAEKRDTPEPQAKSDDAGEPLSAAAADCCRGHEEPGCGDEACREAICAADPRCCDAGWDSVCALTAVRTCESCRGDRPTFAIAEGPPLEAHGCCERHDDAGCDEDSCRVAVCETDPFCCETRWDQVCAELARDRCGSCKKAAPPGADAGLDDDADADADAEAEDDSDSDDPACPLEPGRIYEERIGGRDYHMWVGAKAEFPAPYIFAWHGWTGDKFEGERYEPRTHWTDAVVLAPRGMDIAIGSGDTGRGFQFKKNEVDDRDLELFDALFEEYEDKGCLDPKRVYSAGYSNGGFMSHLLACYRRDKVAAVVAGASSGPLIVHEDPAHADTPPPDLECDGAVPVMLEHSANDELIPLDRAKTSWRFWLKRNGCDVASEVPTENCADGKNCPAETPVRFCTRDVGHTWFTSPQEVADFLRAHTR